MTTLETNFINLLTQDLSQFEHFLGPLFSIRPEIHSINVKNKILRDCDVMFYRRLDRFTRNVGSVIYLSTQPHSRKILKVRSL